MTLPLLLGQLVDGVQRGTQHAEPIAELYTLTAWYLTGIGAAYVLREALNIVRRYLVTKTLTRINRDMYLRLMTHLLTVPLASLARDKVGTLHGRIGRSVDGLVRFLRLSFLDFVPAILTGLFALATTTAKAPLIGTIMLGVIPLSIFLTVKQLMTQKGVRRGLMQRCEEIDGAIVEQLSGIEYIRAAYTNSHEIARLARATEARRVMELHHHFEMSLFGSGKALNEGLFHILVLSFSIHEAIQGRLTFGDVLTFSILFTNVMTPLGEIHRVLDEGHESSLQVADLLEMLAIPPDPSFATTTNGLESRRPHFVPGQPSIVVSDLHVEYNAADERRPQVLHGISLTIRHGETIGIAGRSGGGKSTLVKVLLRLVHPCGGQVLIGDLLLEDVSRAEIGRLVGYVGQSPFVFAGTIAENIAYGNEHVTRGEIQRAAEMAHLHFEVLSFPLGYDTLVTERGQNLSGGQRQRLALARVLLRQPPIMILDEATSALDNISERQVQRALGMTSADRTTIIVAHRLSTLRNADCIFVFEDGLIAESGSYDDLVAAGGVFAELVASAEKGVSEEWRSPAGSPPERLSNNPAQARATTSIT